MNWILGQNEDAARMMWLLLSRFHNGYVKWDDVREAIDMMFLVLLSWLLQKAVGKLSISTGSSLPRFRKIRGQIPIVRYADGVIFMVNNSMIVERMVRYMNDAIFATADAIVDRGRCETLRSAHSGRLRLIQDFRPMNDVNLSHGMMHSTVDDEMPRLVSSATSSTSSTCEVYEEF